MGGSIRLQAADASRIAKVVIGHAGKLNAISVAMWGELQATMQALQSLPPADAPRVVVLSGEHGHFAAGADIEEFPQFRFAEATLRHYHEDVIAAALQAMLECDIPLIAQIDGACVGGGLEIAACCDIRIGGASSYYGIPIAKLGFPIAPFELAVVRRVLDDATLRELLLEARLLDAEQALLRGVVHRVVPDADVANEAQLTAQRIAALAPQAARVNKQSLRRPAHQEDETHFRYADNAEHREGVTAFLAKRKPRFE
jgi:enoyl-CoA hydratase